MLPHFYSGIQPGSLAAGGVSSCVTPSASVLHVLYTSTVGTKVACKVVHVYTFTPAAASSLHAADAALPFFCRSPRTVTEIQLFAAGLLTRPIFCPRAGSTPPPAVRSDVVPRAQEQQAAARRVARVGLLTCDELSVGVQYSTIVVPSRSAASSVARACVSVGRSGSVCVRVVSGVADRSA